MTGNYEERVLSASRDECFTWGCGAMHCTHGLNVRVGAFGYRVFYCTPCADKLCATFKSSDGLLGCEPNPI